MVPTAAQGLVMPSMETLVAFHPNFALAIALGVKVRPTLRTLQAQFPDTSVPQLKPASFDDTFKGPGFVSTYSIFTGFDHTIDPTNAFDGNVLKTVSDEFQSKVSGITFTLFVKGDTDYTPIPFDTPLQLVSKILNPTAGMWSMDATDNVKAQFTLQSSPAGDGPITVWAVFSFLQLGEGARPIMCLPVAEARAQLRALGFGCLCAKAA